MLVFYWNFYRDRINNIFLDLSQLFPAESHQYLLTTTFNHIKLSNLTPFRSWAWTPTIHRIIWIRTTSTNYVHGASMQSYSVGYNHHPKPPELEAASYLINVNRMRRRDSHLTLSLRAASTQLHLWCKSGTGAIDLDFARTFRPLWGASHDYQRDPSGSS